MPESASPAWPGAKRPTDGTRPKSTFSSTNTQTSSAITEADLVVQDRREPGADRAPQGGRGETAEHDQQDVAWRRAPAGCRDRRGSPLRSPNDRPIATDASQRNPAASRRDQLRADHQRPARREDERRADRPEPVLARDDEHRRERGEDGRETADSEQVSLVAGLGRGRRRLGQEAGRASRTGARARPSSSSSPSVVRVERIFSSSDAELVDHASPPCSAVSWRKISSRDVPFSGQLVEGDARGERDLADTLAAGRAGDEQGAVGCLGRLDAAPARSSPSELARASASARGRRRRRGR